MLGIDIRIETTMPRNMKIRRLALALGDGAAFSLIRLWCHAREEFPTDGILRNLSDDEVEAIVAEWKGERGAFLKTCFDLRLLERVDGFVAIHDWEKNQPWAIKADARGAARR